MIDADRQRGHQPFLLLEVKTAAIAQKYNCALKRLDFQQEEGLMSSLPIGVNQVEIERGLTTSSTAVFVPFTTQAVSYTHLIIAFVKTLFNEYHREQCSERRTV